MALVEVSGAPVEIAAAEKSEVASSIDQHAEDATEANPPTLTEVNPKVDQSADVSGDSCPGDINSPPSDDDRESSTPPAALSQDQTPEGLTLDEIPSKETVDPPVNKEITDDPQVAVTEVKDPSPDGKSLVAEFESESPTAEEVTAAAAISHVAPTAKNEIPAPNNEHAEDAGKEFYVEKADQNQGADFEVATDVAPEEKILSAEETSNPVGEETPAAEVNAV